MSNHALSSSMAQSHSASLMNTLLKTQHEILLAEMAKLETLNQMVINARERREA